MSDDPNSQNQDTETEVTPAEASEPAQTEQTENAEKFDINTVIQDALKVVTKPFGFYRDMPTQGGYTNPIIFVVVLALATALVGFVFNLIGLAKFNAVIGGAMTIGMLILVPIFAVIGSFIGGAILYVIWKLIGSEKNFETAYRCVAYSFAIGPIIAVISIIPYVAGIIKSLWGFFLLYAASIEVHKLKEATAKIVFGVLAAIVVITGITTERATRKWVNWAEEVEKSYEDGSIGEAVKELENMGEMTPEEAGRKMGEFLKGMEEFSKGLEDSVKEAEEKPED